MSTKEFKSVFTADNKDLDKKMSQSKKSIGDWAKGIAGALAAAFSIKVIISFGKELVALASKAEGVKIAFERLNKPALLDDLRKATRGTVTDLNLMQKAVQAKNFKIPLDQLATYFEFATKRAIQTGESVDYLVDSIITGIGRKSVLVMDNLGISAVELQDEVKKTGDFATAAGTIIQRELTGMGDVADTASTKMAALSASTENFKTNLGKAITKSRLFSSALTDLNIITQDVIDTQEGLEAIASAENISKWDKFLLKFGQYTGIGKVAIKEVAEVIEKQDKLKDAIDQTIEPVVEVVKNIAYYREEIKTLTDSLEGLTAGEGIRAEQIKTQIADLQTLIDETLNYTTAVERVPQAVLTTDTSGLAIPGLSPEIDNTSLIEYINTLGDVEHKLTSAELAAESFGNQIMAAGIQGSESMEEFGRTALNIAKQVIAAYVAEAIAGAVKSALVGVPFPFNMIAAGIAGGTAAALINAAIPSFAAGGGVSGPTMALVGEAPGISASNPEYIGTASQLAQMGIGGGRLTARVSRGDLLFILNEGKSFNTRNY